MKLNKVFMSGAMVIAMAFAMTACNGNNNNEAVEDTTATCTETVDEHACCQDSAKMACCQNSAEACEGKCEGKAACEGKCEGKAKCEGKCEGKEECCKNKENK